MSHEDEEEDEKELSPEKKAKLEDLKDRTRDLMMEAIEIGASDKEKELFETKFKEVFKREKIPWMFNNIKTFYEGMEFGIFIARDSDMMSHTMMHLQRIIKNMEKDIKSKTKHIS